MILARLNQNIAPQPVKRKEVETSTEELKDFTLDEDIDSMPVKESVVDEMDDFLGENNSASSDFDIADESPNTKIYHPCFMKL